MPTLTPSYTPQDKRGPKSRPSKVDALRREVEKARAESNRLRNSLARVSEQRDSLGVQVAALQKDALEVRQALPKVLAQLRELHPHIEHVPGSLRAAFEGLYRDIVDLCHEGAEEISGDPLEV